MKYGEVYTRPELTVMVIVEDQNGWWWCYVLSPRREREYAPWTGVRLSDTGWTLVDVTP